MYTSLSIKTPTMKYFIIILLLSVRVIPAQSQVYKFKAFETFGTSDEIPRAKPEDWTKVDFLVVVNITKDKINTYGEKEGDYDIIKYLSNSTDEDGDKVIKWVCVDEAGEKCNVQLTVFKDTPDKNIDHFATLSVVYPSVKLYFRLKKE